MKKLTSKDIKNIDNCASIIISQCSEDFVEKFKCPICRKKMNINFHPAGTAFTLSDSEFHFFKTYEIEEPPQWWHKYASNSWLD